LAPAESKKSGSDSSVHGLGEQQCESGDDGGLILPWTGWLIDNMIIHWGLLVPGMLLLFYPADRLLSSVVQLRSFDCFQSLENSARHRPWWWVPVLWLDPLRGFLGGVLLKQSFGLVSIYWSQTAIPEYYTFIGLLTLAIWCQTYTRRDADVMLAPIGFIIGLIVALTTWQVALGGLIIGLTGLFAFRQFHGFFIMALGAVALLGFVLEVKAMWLVPAVGALSLPMLISFLSSNDLEIPTRDATHQRTPTLD